MRLTTVPVALAVTLVAVASSAAASGGWTPCFSALVESSTSVDPNEPPAPVAPRVDRIDPRDYPCFGPLVAETVAPGMWPILSPVQAPDRTGPALPPSVEAPDVLSGVTTMPKEAAAPTPDAKAPEATAPAAPEATAPGTSGAPSAPAVAAPDAETPGAPPLEANLRFYQRPTDAAASAEEPGASPAPRGTDPVAPAGRLAHRDSAGPERATAAGAADAASGPHADTYLDPTARYLRPEHADPAAPADPLRSDGYTTAAAPAPSAAPDVVAGEAWVPTAAAAAGAAGLVAPVLVLYRRLRAREVLDNTVRKDAFDFIVQNPGVTCADIARSVGVHYKTALEHLRVLHQFGHVTLHNERAATMYFENHGRYPEDARRRFALLRRPELGLFLHAVSRAPGIGVTEHARRLGIPKSTASRRASALKTAGLVAEDPAGGLQVTGETVDLFLMRDAARA